MCSFLPKVTVCVLHPLSSVTIGLTNGSYFLPCKLEKRQRLKCVVASCHVHHQFLQGPLPVVVMDQQNFLDGALLEAHLIELLEEIEKLFRLWKCVRQT